MSHYISIRQPFAGSVIHGNKDIENRSWSSNHRGRLWIHASKSRASLFDGSEFIESIGEDVQDEDEMVFGAFIGYVDMVDCVTESDSPWFSDDGFGFVFRNPVAIRNPIIFVANTGIRPIPKELLRKLK
jgi:hypothetical protein